MANTDSNIGIKINKFFKNLGGGFHNKYGKAIESLPSKAYSLTENVDKTIRDIPAIALEQAYTAGPRLLDTVNDFVKPIKRTVQGFATGKAPTGDNYIDKIGDQARKQKEQFYATHKFNQGQNKEYGQLLGSALEAAAPLPGTKAKVAGETVDVTGKYGPKIIAYIKGLGKKGETIESIIEKTKGEIPNIIENSKALIIKEGDKGQEVKTIVDKANDTFGKVLAKDRKIKKAKDNLAIIEKKYSKEAKNLTEEEQKIIEQHIESEKQAIAELEKNAFDKHVQTLQKNTKVSKELTNITNPKKPLSKTAKTLLTTLGLGLGGATINELLSSEENGNGKEKITTTVKNELEQGLSDNKDNGGNINNDTSKEDKTQEDNKKQNGSASNTEQPTGGNSTPIVAGEVYSKDGSTVPLYLIGDSYKVKKPDGTYYTLTTGVNNENKRHKYTMIANQPLPF